MHANWFPTKNYIPFSGFFPAAQQKWIMRTQIQNPQEIGRRLKAKDFSVAKW